MSLFHDLIQSVAPPILVIEAVTHAATGKPALLLTVIGETSESIEAATDDFDLVNEAIRGWPNEIIRIVDLRPLSGTARIGGTA